MVSRLMLIAATRRSVREYDDFDLKYDFYFFLSQLYLGDALGFLTDTAEIFS